MLLMVAEARAAPFSEDGWVTRTWTIDDGLPLDHINALAQTPDGFIWIATFDGLIRFDGRTFEAIRRATHPALLSDRIIDLHVAADGSLWLITEGGELAQLHDDTLTPWPLPFPVVAFSPVDGELFALGYPGLVRWVDGQPVPLPDDPDAPYGRTGHLAMDRDGSVWAGDEAFLHRIAPGGTIHHTPHSLGRILALQVDADGQLLIAHIGGFSRLSGDGLAALPWSEEGHGCGFAWTAQRQLLLRSFEGWSTLTDGALVPEHPLVKRQCQPHHALHETRDVLWRLVDGALLRDGEVVLPIETEACALLIDRDGAAWVGTLGGGLHRVRPRRLRSIGREEGLAGDNVRAVSADGDGGVWVVVADEPTLSHVTSEGIALLPQPPRELLTIRANLQDTTWVGGAHTLCALSGLDCSSSPPIEPGPTAIAAHDGVVAATPQGLFRWHPDTARLEALSELHVMAMAPMPGGLLLGTRGSGLHILRGDRPVALEHSGAPASSVRGITAALGGGFWLATEGEGACWLPEATAQAQVRCLGPAQGLPAGTVHSVQPDDQGRLWLSTNTGLALIRLADAEAVFAGEQASVHALLLSEEDGLRDREGNGTSQPAATRTNDGRLWFATQGGVATVDPAAFPSPAPPAVWLTGLRIGDERVPVPARQSLTAAQRELWVSWSAPEFAWPEQVRFQHRLKGYSDTWSEPTDSRQFMWTNLPPGDLQIEVRAGLGGQWGDPAVLPIHRAPTFRETVWFSVAIGLLCVLLGGAVLYLRVRRLQRQRDELAALVETRTTALKWANDRQRSQTDQLSEKNEQLEVRNTQMRLQAARLRELDTMKTRFVANISHELRTPIALTIGPLGDVIASGVLPAGEQQRLERSLRNAERLGELIEQVLDVARLDEDGVPLRAQHRDLSRFLSRICDRFTEQASRRGLTLCVEPSEEVWGYFDPDLLDKVITNLISNALKFTDEGGVTVSLVATDEHARVAVSDTGPGVTEAERARLFERFYQTDASATRRHGGAGIGLTLAAELVSLHGGDIGVDSTPGKGSTFWFSLPLDAMHLSPSDIGTERRDSTPIAPPVLSGERPVVLLVEDHPDMRAYLVEHLQLRFDVIAASDGLTALAAAAAHRPAAIVSDVMMPGIDGLELCRRIRADDALAGTPIILVTARASEDDRVEGLSVADDYLTKPFRMGELLARVQSLVQRSPAEPEVEAEAEPTLPEVDQRLLEKLEQTAAAHRSESGFGVAQLADRMAMSRRQLQREVNRLTGSGPKEYLRDRRLSHARDLLQRGAFSTVSEVAAAVGLSPNYFSRAYAAWAGHAPSRELKT